MGDPHDRLHRGDSSLVDDEVDVEGEEQTQAQQRRASNAEIAARADATRERRRSEQYHQVGRASWYGDKFAGKPMANGEPFDPEKMTCAHPSLPLGTDLEVTLLDHPFNKEPQPDGSRTLKKGLVAGARVNVTVTDRGPYSGGRILDLSEAAARALGAIGAGVFMVGIKK